MLTNYSMEVMSPLMELKSFCTLSPDRRMAANNPSQQKKKEVGVLHFRPHLQKSYNTNCARIGLSSCLATSIEQHFPNF